MKRATKYELNSIITTIIVLVIVVFVMLISNKHHYKFDLTKNKKHSLAEQTVNILKKMTVKVNAVAFYSKGLGQEKEAKDLLDQYHYTNPLFSYEIFDPDKKPELAEKYGVSGAGNIVVECGDKRERVREAAEEALTNAVVKVTRTGKKKVYFLTGQDELPIDDTGSRGLSGFKEALEKEVYETKPLDLRKEQGIPPDAAIVVVAGAKAAFEPRELELLKNYLDKGGRAFFLLGMQSQPDLSAFLDQYGFKIENGVVIDEVSVLFAGSAAIPAILPPDGYGNHKIVENFRLKCFFPLTRAIEVDQKKVAGATLSPLAYSTANSYIETDMKMLEKGKSKYDPRKSKRGAMCLAAAGAYQLPEKTPPATPAPDKKPEEKGGRIVVWGSSLAASNSMIGSGNKDFALNSVGWLAEEEDLISIRPKEEKSDTIQLQLREMVMVLFGVLMIPAFLILFGVWLRFRGR